jgi:hypothetical protein
VDDEEFGRAVKQTLTRAYDQYLERLRNDQRVTDEQLREITNDALADIFRAIDGLPAAAHVRAGKLALAVSVRTALQAFHTAQRAELEAAKRRRFSDN